MTDEPPTIDDAAPAVDPALRGPYTTDNGVCPNGHPLNGYGRCEPLNVTGVCE